LGGGRMRRLSWLDSLVYGFQHRWETNTQYRAAISGAVGLVAILLLCACLGILTVAANTAVAGFWVVNPGGGLGSSGTGTGKLAAGRTFPTSTPATVPAGALAASPIANSQTPLPSPTDAPSPTAQPTATQCAGSCGGGGGGGGSPGTVSGSASPTPWLHGQT